MIESRAQRKVLRKTNKEEKGPKASVMNVNTKTAFAITTKSLRGVWRNVD